MKPLRKEFVAVVAGAKAGRAACCGTSTHCDPFHHQRPSGED